jgi:hypothetical protein
MKIEVKNKLEFLTEQVKLCRNIIFVIILVYNYHNSNFDPFNL